MKICLACSHIFQAKDWVCPICRWAPTQKNGFLAFAPALAESNSGFDSGLFAKLAEVEIGNFWHVSRNQLILWALKKFFPQAQSFLEIGCGTGYVLSGVKEARPELCLSGSEIDCAGLHFARQRLQNTDLFQMDARRIPYGDEFDVIGAFDVIEHIKEDEAVLTQMHRACRSGGGIILTVPQHPFLWSDYDVEAHHVRRYRATELRAKVEKAGFEILTMTSFVSFLLPAMLLSRLKKANPNKKYDVAAQIHKGPFMNKVLLSILNVERGFIRAGISFPCGGSLLLVARKK